MKTTSAKEFDRMADDGEDVSEYLDWSTARHLNIEPKRVNIDFPTWVVNDLDNEARRLGVTRQSLVKLWIAERLETGRHAK